MKKNVHEIEIKLDSEWVKALDEAFVKQNKEVEIDGFRKGKAPKNMFLKKYGIEVLYGDAVDIVVNEAYKKALDDNKLIPVCEPSVDVVGISDSNVIFKFTIITAPEVTLGEYKNLKIKTEKAKVTKEEVESEIEHIRNHFADMVTKDSEVESGDTAVIDFVGSVDGKEFDGGKGENYSLEIGSNTFIPGFEDGLIGLKAGDEKDLNLKFPDNYTENLGGKDVLFKVKVNEVKTKVLPELNKDFFEDLGYEDVTNEEELYKKIENDILNRKNAKLENERLDAILEKIAEKAKVDINDEIVHEEVHRMMDEYTAQLRSYGMDLEKFYTFSGMSEKDLHKEMEPEALKRVKYRFILEKIAEVEDITFTEEEIEDGAENLALMYGVTKEELYQAFGSKEVVIYDMKMRKALEIVKENN